MIMDCAIVLSIIMHECMHDVHRFNGDIGEIAELISKLCVSDLAELGKDSIYHICMYCSRV